MTSLHEFRRLLAAVVVVYPERMDTKHDKSTLRQILLAACEPHRFQWYMNNIKFRSELPANVEVWVGTGTTRNEQMHARLNSHYHSTVSVSKRMLTAELNTWLAAEMGVFLKAARKKLSRRVHRVDMKTFVTSSTTLFNRTTWGTFRSISQKEWVSSGSQAKREDIKRKGPSLEQCVIYDTIRGKVVKRVRRSMYQAP